VLADRAGEGRLEILCESQLFWAEHMVFCLFAASPLTQGKTQILFILTNALCTLVFAFAYPETRGTLVYNLLDPLRKGILTLPSTRQITRADRRDLRRHPKEA
jgi:hypothetical protein